MNVGSLANDETAASAALDDDVLVQAHTVVEFHRARVIIRLVNQHMITDKDVWPEVEMAVIQSGARRDVAPSMHAR
jgi:hypothetical protein